MILRAIPFVLIAAVLLIAPAVNQQQAPILLPDGESILVCTNGQPVTIVPPNRAICPIVATDTPTSTPLATGTAVPSMGFVETFDGTPGTPQPWRPLTWDVAVHSRDRETWLQLDSMQVSHGPGCEPPPGQHSNSSYEGAVFQCANHIMTAINARGYGVVYLTPNQMVDFSSPGEIGVIRFDVSTLRTSNRDWFDIWITPYEDNLQAPLEDWLPDLNGEPRRAVHIRMKFGTAGNLTGAFEGQVISNFEDSPLPLRRTIGYESFFPPSALLRQTFELRLSQTHIKFGMPLFDLWWIDTDIAPLVWSSGIVQIGSHSYNPLKDCPLTCQPNTWHFDNVGISPAVPFTIIRADRRFVDPTMPAALNFPQPAPAGSHLRFSGIGNSLEISTDGGATWQVAQLQAQESTTSEHFRSYWTPIPAGTTSVQIRGVNWWGGKWTARDISIWSRAQPQ
jgi:hypothetical protein